LSRIPLPSPETMSPEQRRVYDSIIGGPRGRLVGPLRAALHSPELADRWQRLGEFLRYKTNLSPRVSELAILVCARRWNSHLEWHIHSQAALQAGVPSGIIDAIKAGDAPRIDDEDDAAVYEYARQIQLYGRVSDEVYRYVWSKWGVVGIVELTAVIGYYTMVAMTLNAHEIPLPDYALPPLSPIRRGANGASQSDEMFGLTELPAASD
jgi:4-carboxymuconolactone decarboxylase